MYVIPAPEVSVSTRKLLWEKYHTKPPYNHSSKWGSVKGNTAWWIFIQSGNVVVPFEIVPRVILGILITQLVRVYWDHHTISSSLQLSQILLESFDIPFHQDNMLHGI